MVSKLYSQINKIKNNITQGRIVLRNLKNQGVLVRVVDILIWKKRVLPAIAWKAVRVLESNLAVKTGLASHHLKATGGSLD